MTQSDGSSFAEQLIDTALQAGAEAAEVFAVHSINRPVLFEANVLKQIETRDSAGTSLRLWVEGRPGLAVTYGKMEPIRLVETAIALSQLNEPEQIELTAIPPEIVSGQYGEPVEVRQLIHWGEKALSGLLATDPKKDLQCVLELDTETSTTAMLNSKGLACRYTSHMNSVYGSAEWVRGEDFLCVEAEQTRHTTLDIAEFVESIAARLRWAKSRSTPPIGRMPILFAGKAADLLWTTVEAALSSKRVIENASPWSDRLCEPVVSPLLTLLQDPHIGPFGCPFDDEGISTRRVEFIREGELQLFYTDRTTGRQLGCGSTGNGFRPGLERYPSPGLFNLMVLPGDDSFEALVAEIQDGLIVDQFLGDSGSISGDFAISVDLGYRVKKGKIVGRVKDTLVSGNVYDALNQVIALGNDAAWHGSCYTPSILVDGLSVTA
ncbi:TldD/PmbA family protein [Altericista sp. CCNU0014]|uniref:TldD/PmbA family protein n=1 Tax=Altericista sp. CCNU0014 TaxID=3082949 RepID=UPI00384FF08B